MSFFSQQVGKRGAKRLKSEPQNIEQGIEPAPKNRRVNIEGKKYFIILHYLFYILQFYLVSS